MFHEVREAQGGGPAHARHTVHQRLASCRSHLHNKTVLLVNGAVCRSVLRSDADSGSGKSAEQGPGITRHDMHIHRNMQRVRVTTVTVHKQ